MDSTQVYSHIALLTAIVAVLIFVVAIKRRSSAGAVPLALFMAAIAEWSITSAMEMNAYTIPDKLFWGKLAYFGIMSSPVLFFWFALQYHQYPIKKWLLPFLLGFPLAAILLAFTNDLHHLLWPGFNFIPGTNIMVYEHGPLFWVIIPIIYSFLVAGVVLFLRSTINPNKLYRKQATLILASSIFPILGNILYITGNSPIPGMDPTPIGFAITGIFLTWGLFQYRILDIIPFLRDTIIDNMTDGVIITDSRHRILDYNQAIVNMFNLDQKPEIGHSIEQHFPEIMPILKTKTLPDGQYRLDHNSGKKTFGLRKIQINQNKEVDGYALYVTDITERINIENSLRESEEKYRQLLDNASFPLMICDLQTGSVIYQNKLAKALFRPSTTNGHEYSIANLFCDSTEYTRLSSIILKNRIVTDYETQVFSNLTKKIWVLTSASIIPYANEEAILVSFNDITSRKLMEEAEKEQRQFNEAMVDSASALNSTLDFDEVLDRILTNLEKVIPHNVANIMLVSEGGEVKIVRAHGYGAKELQSLFQKGQLSVSETPFLLKMAMSGSPIVITDTLSDSNWVKSPGMERTRSYLGVPIFVKGKIMGYINVESTQPHDYTTNHGKRLMAFADQAAVAIENSRMFEKLEQMAVVDTLTGLYSRRHFADLGGKEIERARRYGNPLSLLMIDLDHFKNFNDTFGHAVGDQILVEVANIIGTTLRKIDIPGRLGGEEFAVLLPETNQQNGMLVAERLRQAISRLRIPLKDRIIDNVTASFGLSTLCDNHIDLQSLITSADMAMYKAKENGRNMVVVDLPEVL
jgi:diguanylate cyclase (GGDEF)-like protein/PAS domain S-box-containing protein